MTEISITPGFLNENKLLPLISDYGIEKKK